MKSLLLFTALLVCLNARATQSNHLNKTTAVSLHPRPHLTDIPHTNETGLAKRRDKRVAVTTAISWALTAVNVVCSLAKIPHKMCVDSGCIGPYATINKEMEYYMNELKAIKAYIPCMQDQLQTLKSKLLMSFETFEYSVVKVGAVVNTYDDLNKGLAMFKNLSAESLGLDVDLDSQTITDFLKLSNPSKLSDTGLGWGELGLDVAGDIGQIMAIELTQGITKLFAKAASGGGIINSIITKGAQDAMSEWTDVVADVMSGVNIALKIAKIGDCIRDHSNIYSNRVEERNNLKKMYDNAKIALKELEEITNRVEDAVGRFNKETDKLVTFTNDFLAIFNSSCKSSPATLTSDLGEVKHFVQNMKEEFDVSVDIDQGIQAASSLAVQTLKQFKPSCMPPHCDFEASCS